MLHSAVGVDVGSKRAVGRISTHPWYVGRGPYSVQHCKGLMLLLVSLGIIYSFFTEKNNYFSVVVLKY